MRRVIERTVITVTTTTWKISWEADPPQPDHTADHVSHEVLRAEILSETAQSPQIGQTVIEAKEVDPAEREKVFHQSADEPPKNPTYPLKKGNEKS